jgi:uncharacterized membrane protein (UPF0127 family)
MTKAFHWGGFRFAFAVTLALAVALHACGGAAVDRERVMVTVGPAAFDAELALTQGQRSLGLGGRDELPDVAGMLFVFKQDGDHRFWMKDMRFPLDFVWIDAARSVVNVTEDVPPPEEGTSTDDLPFYQAGEPVAYVLEINAGLVARLGIRVGDTVTFEPEVDRDRAQ